MERIKLHDKFFRPYIPHGKVAEATERVAALIDRDYADYEGVPLIVSVLNGSFAFTAELMKHLKIQVELTFIKLQSYSGTASTGVVKEILGLDRSVRGRKVIIVEDIVDTGKTISDMMQTLTEAGAEDIRVCTMFLKPDAYKASYPIHYPAMNIGNEFVVGFGLDYDQLGRQYQDIYIIDDDRH